MKTKGPFTDGDVESGSSLLTALFSIFFLGLSTLLITDGLKIFMKNRAQIEYLASRAALKRMLINATDCQQLKSCSTNEGVSVYDSTGSVLVKADASTRFRSLRVRAVCSQNSIVEISAMPWSASGTSVEPLSGKPLSWTDKNLLLVNTAQICPGLPQASGPIKIINGPLCKAEKGTCPSPNGSVPSMCCPDGRNGLKPKCASHMREVGAYWDRNNDLGVDGFWVVFCQ